MVTVKLIYRSVTGVVHGTHLKRNIVLISNLVELNYEKKYVMNPAQARVELWASISI